MSLPTNSAALAGFTKTPDVSDPSGVIAGYWTDPPGVVLRFVRPSRGTTKLAEWLIGPGFELLTQRFPGEAQLRIVLDMAQMTGRSATARAVLMQSAARFAPFVGQIVIVPSMHMGAAYLKVVEASAAILRLVGLRIDIELAVDRAVAKHGIRAALPDLARIAPPAQELSRRA
jgi:hypothetical protein